MTLFLGQRIPIHVKALDEKEAKDFDKKKA